MTETSQVNAFPQYKSTPNTKRSIVGPMFDDEEESEYSFVHPYGDKRCNIKRSNMLERISNNLKDVHHFGKAVRLHFDLEVKKQLTRAIEEDYESDSSNERISKSKTINYIFDRATVCAGNIRAVAGEINEINPCGGAMMAAGGDSYDDSKPQQRQKPKMIRKKKASEACVHDGILGDLSDSDEESFKGSESTWSYSSSSISSSSISSYESNPRPHTNELRRKKQHFIQETAGIEARDIDKSFQQLHTQEMRPSPPLSRSKHGSFVTELNATNWAPEMSPDTIDSNVIDVSNGLPINLNQLSWESKETTIVIGSDQARNFLTSSHIGPVITKITSYLQDLQLGDVIIRFQGEDVSTLDGEILSDLLIRCKGKCIRITYLRKTMLV